jgi:hypothetical protein
MIRSQSILRLAVVCAVLFGATVSGCRTISGSIGKTIASSPEAAKYDSTCEQRCADKVGEDYDNCYLPCLLAERKRAKGIEKEKQEKEKAEFEKRSNEQSAKDQER